MCLCVFVLLEVYFHPRNLPKVKMLTPIVKYTWNFVRDAAKFYFRKAATGSLIFAVYGIFSLMWELLSCGMWNLVPQPGSSRPPTLGVEVQGTGPPGKSLSFYILNVDNLLFYCISPTNSSYFNLWNLLIFTMRLTEWLLPLVLLRYTDMQYYISLRYIVWVDLLTSWDDYCSVGWINFIISYRYKIKKENNVLVMRTLRISLFITFTYKRRAVFIISIVLYIISYAYLSYS